MRSTLRYAVLLVGLSLLVTRLAAAATPVETRWVLADDEYDTYRKKGDDAFKAGRYAEARRQYQNCLEVPGFENDKYAKERIEVATRCLTTLQQVDDAVQSQDDSLIVAGLRQVLSFNPDDAPVMNRLADHFELKGNALNQANRLRDAQTQYALALDYAKAANNRVKQSTLETQLGTISVRLDQSESEREASLRTYAPSQPIVVAQPMQQRQSFATPALKIGLGTAALGTGLLAYSLRRNFNEKFDTVKELAAKYAKPEPDRPERMSIPNPVEYKIYEAAYAEMEAAHKRQGLYRICLGVAAAAVVADIYLFVRKPKLRQMGYYLQPANSGYGLTAGYRF